ncbi:MAG TPA: ribose 5-phosphate isomerase B [Alphaproteobacteria bacterium]|nr:ribose 5-phosphate isomerase B [Alphaproteobacteria bacterium]
MKILIASDHAGFELKEYIKSSLSAKFDFIDLGTNSDESVDYPDFGKKLAAEIENKTAEFGIVICGSGIGISIAANRNKAVRAALCLTEEMALLARKHNDANVLALGARLTPVQTNLNIIEKFFSTSFDGGRHSERVNKLGC